MQEPNNPHRSSLIWNAIFFIIALLVVIADQLTKLWIRATLAIGQSIPETGFFQLTHIQNTGAAFGLFRDQSLYLTVIAFLGAIMLILYFLVIRYHIRLLDNRLSKIAMGLVLGGTVGNLIDRLRFGRVTDFIDPGFFPIFNVADSAITIGVILVIYSLLRETIKENK